MPGGGEEADVYRNGVPNKRKSWPAAPVFDGTSSVFVWSTAALKLYAKARSSNHAIAHGKNREIASDSCKRPQSALHRR